MCGFFFKLHFLFKDPDQPKSRNIDSKNGVCFFFFTNGRLCLGNLYLQCSFHYFKQVIWTQTHPLIEKRHYATKYVFQKLKNKQNIFQSTNVRGCWCSVDGQLKQTLSAKEHFSVVCTPGAWHYSEAHTKQYKYVLASMA